MNLEKIKVIAFDADDTLWVNEPYFRKVEEDFCKLLSDYLLKETCLPMATESNHLPFR